MSHSDHHIVLVSPLPPPIGGVAIWTETIRQRGLGSGWRVSIVNSRMRGRSVADRRTKLNVEILRSMRILGSLARVLVFDRPDIVHINCSLSERGVFRDAMVMAFTRLFRVSAVSNLHGNFLPGERTAFSRWTRFAYRYIFRHSKQIVVLNAASKDGVRKLGKFSGVTSVVPSFIDVDAIPEKSETKNERFKVAYLGALLESKGLATILEVAARLPESDFVLVGDAPAALDNSPLIDRARALKNVELTGALPSPSALQVLAASDVLIFPSHSEGFPNVVAESMAIGLPVIASPVGAISEMIDQPAGGFLIPHNLVNEYVEAIQTLAANRPLAREMGQYNREKAVNSYSYNDVISRWRSIYETIV